MQMKQSSIRGVLVALLTLALALTGLAVQPAAAALTDSVSGTGAGSSDPITITDDGIYEIQFEYSGASDLVTAVLYDSESEELGGLAFNDAATGVTKRLFVGLAGEDVLVGVDADDEVSWAATITPVAEPTVEEKSFVASGIGLDTSGLYLLDEGTYSYTATYSGNQRNDALQFDISLSAFDLGALAAHPLVDEPESASGKVNGTFTLGQPGLVWIDPASIWGQASWEVDVRSTLTKTPTPTITGTPTVGKTLTAAPGTWEPTDVSLDYQWYRGADKISGATQETYKLAAADKGKTVKVAVTGSLAGYQSVTKTSKATATVNAGKITAATPTITGTKRVGSKLTAKPGTWKPTSVKLTYQWYRGKAKISGATKSTYTLKLADRGKTIKVKVTGKKSGYTTVSKTSKVTAAVKAGKITAITPKISGTKKVRSKLTAKPGTWKPTSVKLTYQWYRGKAKISGATKSTYTLKPADNGKTIKVKVTGKKSGYTTVSKTSKVTAKITYPSRTAPISLTSCPSWAPIKGNESSMIYHMKGQRFYDRTHPEDCFRTEAAAKAAGYRKAKV